MAGHANPRRVALDVLDRVLDRGQPFDETFAGHPGLEALSVRDRGFARLLITTVLRRRGQLDEVLDRFLTHRPKGIRIQNLLRLGAAQILVLETPVHAAVGETVALASRREAFARGLVNAVLRQVAAGGTGLLRNQDAALLNTPAWLFETWSKAYGEARARAIAAVHQGEPPLDLSVKGDPSGWAGPLEGTHLVGSTVRRVSHGAIEALPGYDGGAFWVQDVAATLPAKLMGNIEGRTVIDLCAAPGGKTAQLAAAGAQVIAVEVSPKRALRLRQNLARLQLEAEVVEADALAWQPSSPAPLVLLDAPCSATGTIRRHPDVAWSKTQDDVAKMADLQGRLLAAATTMLAPGGTLVYASCSLQPEEGPDVVARALAAGTPLERVPIGADELGLAVDVTPLGEVRTLPCHLAERGGMDGFFIVRLRRAA